MALALKTSELLVLNGLFCGSGASSTSHEPRGEALREALGDALGEHLETTPGEEEPAGGESRRAGRTSQLPPGETLGGRAAARVPTCDRRRGRAATCEPRDAVRSRVESGGGGGAGACEDTEHSMVSTDH